MEFLDVEASFKKASDAVANWLGRRVDLGDVDVVPAREAQLPPNWPGALPYRKRPKPYSRAIAWTPATGENRHDRKRPYELFVAQPVLREVRQHLITATAGEPFGFLLGQVVHCPWTNTPYIVIDSIRRESQDLPPANDMDRFRHAWVAAGRDARRRKGEVLGWYHRHGILGLNLSEWDLRLQEEFFPEAWHCALVVASAEAGIVGGFIQRSRRARLFRKGLAPFHELVDIDAKLVNGVKPSVVDWGNYVAGEDVNVIKAEWPASAVRRKKWKTPHADDAGRGSGGPPPESTRAARSKAFTGRRWRAADAEPASRASDKPRPPIDDEGFSDEFADAVGPLPEIWEAEEAEGSVREAAPPAAAGSDARADPSDEALVGKDSRAAPTKTRGGKTEAADEPAPKKAAAKASGGKKPKKRAPKARARETSARASDAPNAGVGSAAATAGVDDAWYSSDFRDAVWGPAPFGPEGSEPPASVHDRAPEAAGAATHVGPGRRDDAAAGDVDATRSASPRFELLPPMEPEPPEIDRPSSLEWLLTLVGDSLGKSSTTDEEAAAQGDAAAHGAGEASADEPQAAEPGADSSTAPPRRGRPAATTPARRRGAPATGGITFVAPSADPDFDREAAIPVVLPGEVSSPRRASRQRVAAGIVVLLAAAAAVRIAMDRPAPVPAPRPTAPAVAAAQAAPSPEFVSLADSYLTALQSYRERVIEHQTGQVDCDALGSQFASLVASHTAIAAFVESEPAAQDRFETLTSEFAEARTRFAASGCPGAAGPPTAVASEPIAEPASPLP